MRSVISEWAPRVRGLLDGGPGSDPAGQPPLTRRGHAWRLVVAAVGGFLMFAANIGSIPQPRPDWLRPVALIDVVVLGPLALVLLAFHRRRPLAVAVVVTSLTAVSSVASVAGLICMTSVAARRRVGEIALVGGLGIASGMAYERLYPTTDPDYRFQLFFITLLLTAVIAIGMFIGARRELVWSLRQRAEAAEREQELRVAQAQAQERARIAREMHDVLAHRISLLSMHAGALAFRTDLPPQVLREEARLIQRTAQDALTELRSVLGVLRTPGEPVERPQPTLAELDDLVGQARGAGPVEVHRALDGAPPEWLGRQAYRIVQESLTNARKHAPGAPVTVTVTGRPGEQLVIEVVDDPARSPEATAGSRGSGAVATVPGAGLGLIGLAERAAAAGGTLEHGPVPDGGYVVRARLPWPPPAEANRLPEPEGTRHG
ncbi:MAG: sensor histidine kinase [Kineosporiaceae bacterium]|nr:sensor histidine kinase [Kineosporiaceae bacterium]